MNECSYLTVKFYCVYLIKQIQQINIVRLIFEVVLEDSGNMVAK